MERFYFILMFISPYFLHCTSAYSMKWDHDISKSMFSSYWNDFDSLKKKFERVNMSREFMELISELEKLPPSSSSFNKLLKKFNSEWNKKCQDLTFDKVVEICEKNHNKDKCCDFFLTVYKNFQSSIETSFIFCPFNLFQRPDSLRINKAIRCLEIVSPNSFVDSNNKIRTIEHISFLVNSGNPKAHEPSLPDTFFGVYNVSLPDGEAPVVTRFKHFKCGIYSVNAKKDYLNEEHFNSLFGRKFSELTMFEFASLKMRIKNNITNEDPNYNLEKIFRKIVSEELNDFCYVLDRMNSWLPKICKNIKNISEAESKILGLEGPFIRVQTLLDFKQPFWLLKSSKQAKVDPFELLKDFATLKNLMKLFQSEVEKRVIEL